MAELEVIKHTKKVYKIFGSDNPILHKFTEFLIEILIIVFAVSITIWLHDWAEHRHQQKEVKEFLIGLKNDLKNDRAEMLSDREGYVYQRSGFRFFRSINDQTATMSDSLNHYTNGIFNKVALVQNNGRFEGFKSSGKVGNIEDKNLQNDILDLYQELIPSLLNTTELYNNQKERLIILIEQKAHIDVEQRKLLLSEVMKTDQAKIISSTLAAIPTEIINRYDVSIARIDSIVAAIDKAYGNETGK